MDAIKKFYGYLCRMKEATIRYRTDMPDLSDLDIQEYDWSRTVYAGSTEQYPENLPIAKRESSATTVVCRCELVS